MFLKTKALSLFRFYKYLPPSCKYQKKTQLVTKKNDELTEKQTIRQTARQRPFHRNFPLRGSTSLDQTLTINFYNELIYNKKINMQYKKFIENIIYIEQTEKKLLNFCTNYSISLVCERNISQVTSVFIRQTHLRVISLTQ